LRPFGVGHTGTGLRVITAKREGFGHKIEVKGPERSHHIYLPLVGDFQLSNALVAAGLVIATGGEETLAMHALESLKGARGRLELVGKTNEGAPVFVDYAHTPDALENALSALRPYARGRLAVVFGAGGDRDRGKRPLMGAAAAKLADRVIVTDDNPRTEDPALIRAAVLAAAPGAAEIGNRAEAIATAVRGLEAGDVLLVAGKGHEEGQTIGKETVPFSDHEAVTHALRGEPYHG
jgi:UDP-N-acetylmuramoyl-L-alanyl-D-glutamate--2,6-diaminopimelate ligase